VSDWRGGRAGPSSPCGAAQGGEHERVASRHAQAPPSQRGCGRVGQQERAHGLGLASSRARVPSQLRCGIGVASADATADHPSPPPFPPAGREPQRHPKPGDRNPPTRTADRSGDQQVMARQVRPWSINLKRSQALRVRSSDWGADQLIPSGTAAMPHRKSGCTAAISPSNCQELKPSIGGVHVRDRRSRPATDIRARDPRPREGPAQAAWPYWARDGRRQGRDAAVRCEARQPGPAQRGAQRSLRILRTGRLRANATDQKHA
jgi:hypothetical protein